MTLRDLALYIIFVIPVIVSIGCVPQRTVYITAGEEKAIKVAMEDVSHEDAQTMYKLFRGLENYLSHAGHQVKDTNTLLKLIDAFNTDYGWENEQYPDFTDAVEVFLKKEGYATAKRIVDKVKDKKKEVSVSDVIEDIKVIADGVELAMESKDAD